MKNTVMCGVLLVMFCVSGCVIRTSSHQADRVDQEIKGNRGVLVGTPPPVDETVERKTREVYDIEIELPSLYKKSTKSQDNELSGNRGYLKGGLSPEKEVVMPAQRGGVTRLGGFDAPQVIYSAPVRQEGVVNSQSGTGFYVVEKNDTLQKISQKMYGTTKKWKKIYEANKTTLRSPDKIRPGQKLAIPEE
ncbi:MAG: LysM peptidoglycan-binding domain-containing protein [Candidatus Omnitrophota bacterium]